MRFQKKSFLIWLLAVAALPAGLVMLDTPAFRPHGRDERPIAGRYFGSVHYIFAPLPSNDLNESTDFVFKFSARSKPHWYWDRPTNFVYHELNLEWFRNDEFSNISGTAIVNPVALTYQLGPTNLTLDKSTLASWIMGVTNQPITRRQESMLSQILQRVVAAGKGDLPPTKHHRYSEGSDHIGTVSLTHWALGYRLYREQFAWIAIWFMGVAATRMLQAYRRSPG